MGKCLDSDTEKRGKQSETSWIHIHDAFMRSLGLWDLWKAELIAQMLR